MLKRKCVCTCKACENSVCSMCTRYEGYRCYDNKDLSFLKQYENNSPSPVKHLS